MKIQNILTIFLFTIFFTHSFSQEITVRELKQVFRKASKTNVIINNEWYSEHSKEDYFKADTLVISNKNKDTGKNPIMIWKIRPKFQIDLVEFNSEVEPPVDIYFPEFNKVKVTFKKIGKEIILLIKRNKILIDQFKFIERKTLGHDSFELKLLRIVVDK